MLDIDFLMKNNNNKNIMEVGLRFLYEMDADLLIIFKILCSNFSYGIFYIP